MILPGYCEKCRKCKNVRVSGAGMAMLARGIATGICSQCQQKADDARRASHEARRSNHPRKA